MSLRKYIPQTAPAERSLVLVEGDTPKPVSKMLAETFEDQPVSVETTDHHGYVENTVLLVEDGSVLASSSLRKLQDNLLLINSDLFITGSRDLDDVEVPAIIRNLEGVPFRLWGYPESNTEKLLLILISRFVERRAMEAGSGQLRSSFQRLSRVKDEVGTRSVYEGLSDTDLSVHVYGLPDWIPSRELDLVTHAGRGPNFERAWFVIFEPADTEVDPYGLLAYETEPRRWHGFFTSDETQIAEIATEIRQEM